MNYQNNLSTTSPSQQKGISILVTMVMLLVMTLIGVSSMKTAIVELKMAGSMQQEGLALNRAEEALRVGETDVDLIITDPTAFDFAVVGDSYYVNADAVPVQQIDWAANGIISQQAGANAGDVYVTEYLGAKAIPGESTKISTDGKIIGGFVHTFRITTRSATGKNAVRLIQGIYVSENAP